MKIVSTIKAAVRMTVLYIPAALALAAVNAYADNTPCEFQDKECFTEEGYPACYEKRVIQKYYEFLEDGRESLAEGILAGDSGCVKLSGNQKVYMTDKSSGFVKFEFRGREGTYWAKRAAIYAK